MTSRQRPDTVPDFDHWLAYVRRLADTHEAWRETPPATATPRPSKNKGAQKTGRHVVICSPHPDDECLTGLLALRLLHEDGASVTNLAVTLGSDPARRRQRAVELSEACAVLGFNLLISAEEHGMAGLAQLRMEDAARWQRLVDDTVLLLADEQPDLVLLPHAGDRHPTHVATHWLIKSALGEYVKQHAGTVLVAETEYWHPQPEPNLLVGGAPEDVALLLTALVRHRGEMARAPYHLSYPAWLMDNVRRGGEFLSGYGSRGNLPMFGILYGVYGLAGGGKCTSINALVAAPESNLSFSQLLQTIY